VRWSWARGSGGWLRRKRISASFVLSLADGCRLFSASRRGAQRITRRGRAQRAHFVRLPGRRRARGTSRVAVCSVPLNGTTHARREVFHQRVERAGRLLGDERGGFLRRRRDAKRSRTAWSSSRVRLGASAGAQLVAQPRFDVRSHQPGPATCGSSSRTPTPLPVERHEAVRSASVRRRAREHVRSTRGPATAPCPRADRGERPACCLDVFAWPEPTREKLRGASSTRCGDFDLHAFALRAFTSP